MAFSVDRMLRKANSLARNGDREQAEKLYREILAKVPQNDRAIQGLAKLKALDQVKPPHTAALPQENFTAVVDLYRNGRLEEALKLALRLAQQYPHSFALHNVLGALFTGLGQLESAIASYDKALQIKPDFAEAHNNLGNVLNQLGRHEDAVESCGNALLIKPNFAEAHNNLGNALRVLGRNEEAIESYKKALHIKPDSAEAHNNLGNALKVLARNEEAIESYKKALRIKPEYAEAYNNLGNALKVLGRNEEAIESYKKALRINTDFAEAHNNLGNALKNLGRYKDAIESFNNALRIKPDYADAHNDLGNVLSDLGHHEGAIECYSKALRIKPDFARAHNNLGVALDDLGRHEDAIESYNKALHTKPDFAEALNNLGKAQNELGRYEEAVENVTKALRIKPNFAEAHNNLGSVLKNLGRYDEAIKSYKKALRIKPGLAEVSWNLSLSHLQLGDFKNGWRAYEFGTHTKHRARSNQLAPLPYKKWNGEQLHKKKIILTTEQGVGDELMFSSCLPDLLSLKPDTVICECDERLRPLFQRSFPRVEFHEKINKESAAKVRGFGHIDFQLPIGSLPKHFRSSMESFPCVGSYLTADPSLVSGWRERYAELGEGLKVGISWRGGRLERVKNLRSIDIALWRPILQCKAKFVNLQYGKSEEEIEKVRSELDTHIHDWDDADPLKDLDNFAAQVAALDLVISVDNSTVHFGGSLGTPTWVLLPFSPDWRWMLIREDSPWYPSIRLFRQPDLGDWDSVIDKVAHSLKKIA